MKTRILIVPMFVFLSVVVLHNFSRPAAARPTHKPIILELTPATPAETKVQEMVKVDSCNACHVKDQPKKMRNEFGIAVYNALGGENFKYDKDFWAKTDDKYNPKAIQMLRDAINKASQPK